MNNNPSIRFISVVCPNCGAQMSIEHHCKQAVCGCCGTQLLIHNENEKIVHTIDEADIKRAEAEYKLGAQRIEADTENERLKFELQKLKEENEAKNTTRMLIFAGILLLFLFLFIYVGVLITNH